jgi:hypothetical protein
MRNRPKTMKKKIKKMSHLKEKAMIKGEMKKLMTRKMCASWLVSTKTTTSRRRNRIRGRQDPPMIGMAGRGSQSG